MNAYRGIVFGVLFGLALWCVILCAAFALAGTPSHTEDGPGWNCHTMGNHRCGSAALQVGRGVE